MNKDSEKPKNEVQLLQLIDLLDKSGRLSDPLLKQRVDKALRGNPEGLLQHIKEHPEILGQAQAALFIEGKKKEDNPFYPPPSEPEQIARLTGSLRFGYYNPRKDVFGIDPGMLNLNVLVVGRARSGKSNLNLIALDQLFQLSDSFHIIIIDLKKEYRCLLPRHQALKIITFKNLRLNPLEVPEWQDPKDHINNFAEVFCRENYILAFGKNMLISCLEYIYRQRGIFDGSRNYPTVIDLYNMIKAQKGASRQANVQASLESRLKAYIDYPEIFCGKGFPFNVWLDNNLVIELENIQNEMYATITNLIVSLIYNYYHRKNLRGSKIRTLFVVDEAGVLFNAQRDRPSEFGDSHINTLVRRGGEFGLGFWVTSQEPNTLSQAIHSNSFLKFMFPLMESRQLRLMADSLALSDAQLQFAFKLPLQGTCIVRYGAYPDPLLLDVPLFTDEKAVSDEYVQERMQEFYKAYTPRKAAVEKNAPAAPQITSNIPDDALILLKHIASLPFDNYTSHRSSSNIGEHKVDRAREWLEENGFISTENIKITKGRSRPACYLILTEKARQHLNVKQHLGKGGFKHQLYCHLIKQHLIKQGWTVQIDKPVYPSTKLIDVIAEKGGEKVGYEVTIHFENLNENIEKDLKAINHLVIVVEKNDFSKAGEAVRQCKPFLAADKHIETTMIDNFFV